VYLLSLAPLVCILVESLWAAGVVSFVSALSMCGLDKVAIELENPFGEDANDLPVFEMQTVFNRDLLLQLGTEYWQGSTTHS